MITWGMVNGIGSKKGYLRIQLIKRSVLDSEYCFFYVSKAKTEINLKEF